MQPPKIGAALITSAVAAGLLAPAGPITWSDPSSPLFDKFVCYNESHGVGYGCDPFGPAYDPNFCAAQSGSR
jgi:hypothetical protein